MYCEIIEKANDFLLFRQFNECIEFCAHHLQELKKVEETESTRLAKEGLCVIECQAYAELNRWQEVIPFITQLYEGIEECPAKIVQLGLLLHAQMKDFATCSAIINIWLRNSNNFSNPEYVALAEVYVTNVLIPADRWQQIPQFIETCPGLGTEKREIMLKQVRNLQALKEQATMEAIVETETADSPEQSPENPQSRLQSFFSDFSADSPIHQYVNKVCEWVKSNMSSSAIYFIRNLALIAVILYYLLVKMSWDLVSWPKLASIWALLVRLWKSMFAPYHLAKS